MTNANEPAYPMYNELGNLNAEGLTKREYACIKLGIADTGDKYLDEIILMAERKRIAAMAMQGILSDVHVQLWMKTDPRYDGNNFANVVAINSCEFADALLKQLNHE